MMNKVNNLYRIILIFLIFTSSILLIKNYNMIRAIKYQNLKIQSLDKKQIKKNCKMDYSEVLDELNHIENLHVMNLVNSSNENILLQAEIIGDKEMVKNILTKIQSNNKFYNIGSIKIQQEESNQIKVITDINLKNNN